jgi:hypothetical protein
MLRRVGAFHESGQNAGQHYKERDLWFLEAALPLPKCTSLPHLIVSAHQAEMPHQLMIEA